LLNFIEEFGYKGYGISQKEFNIDSLFLLLKKTKVKIFRQIGYYWNIEFEKLSFNPKPEKIKAELSFKKRENILYNRTDFFFFFKIKEIYNVSDMRNLAIPFCGKSSVVHIRSNKINVNPISPELSKIISRIRNNEGAQYEYEYEYDPNSLETILKDDEIIKLNQIIKDGGECLDLKTELKNDWNIQEFKESEPTVYVDYDSEKNSLEIKPIINYGFSILDIPEVFYISNKKEGKTIARRDNAEQKKYTVLVHGKNIFYSKIDHKKELTLFKDFYDKKDTGFSAKAQCKRQGGENIFEFYKNHWPKIEKLAKEKGYQIKYAKDKFNFAIGDFKADFNVDLNADNDWLWFDINCYCGKDQIKLEDLRKYAKNKKEFIKMSDGRMLRVDNQEELDKFIIMLESFHAKKEGGFEGKLYHATELENVFTNSDYYNAKIQKSFTDFISEAKSGSPVEKIKLPEKYQKVLREYQKEGIDWMYFLRKYRFAGILADDMGLGKTLQALALIDLEKIKGKPSVVVCPKTLLYNWQSEAKKFTPGLKVLVIDGTKSEREEMIKNAKKADLIITGYATMKNDSELYKKEKNKFNYCVLDEAQFIKNHKTKNAQIIKTIDADYRLALTGTPLENNVTEIWSVFDFLMPGFLGPYGSFVRKFKTPIMKNNNASALKDLNKKISCFMLRRTKDKVLKELPQKIEQTDYCHLGKAQNILYQEILINVKAGIDKNIKEKGFNKSQIHILAGLMKLRQVCNHPVLLLKDKDYTKYESAKLDMFLELVEEIIGNKRKVLVFSQFTKMLDILAKELDNKEIKYNYLSGKTKNRQELVDDFNENKEKQVFLISLKAGGTGLNLTSADNVIIFDPWWNPSVENQAIDRTHRIGQKKSVNVYRLITKGTIEEKIAVLQKRKKFLFDNLVGEPENLFQKLTWEDVKGLFE